MELTRRPPARAAAFQFQFAARNAAEGVTITEQGGRCGAPRCCRLVVRVVLTLQPVPCAHRRAVSRGELLPRSDQDGGAGVTLLFPPAGDGAAAVLNVKGFPGYAATTENVFDVAQEFMTARDARHV